MRGEGTPPPTHWRWRAPTPQQGKLEVACPHAAVQGKLEVACPHAAAQGKLEVACPHAAKFIMTSRHLHLPHLSPFDNQPIVFFTACTHNRHPCLDNDTAHDVLRTIWQSSGEKNGWYVGDYVIMPEHVHFFARSSRENDSMAVWTKMWKSVSSRALTRKLDVQPPVWQAEYFDRYLRSDESYHEKWVYVDANPVRAGLAETPESWPFRGRIHELRV